MKRLLVLLIAAGLILAACGAEGSRGGGSFDDATPVAVAPTVVPMPTETPPPTSVPACAPETLNLGDPAAWVEGATVVIGIGITNAVLLPARLQSDNGLDIELRTLDEASRGGTYGPLNPVPSPMRTFTLTLANGAVCTATATILAASPTPLDTPTSVPTDTPVPSPTPLPTSTPTRLPTLAPVGTTATPTRTATPGMAPVTGGEEENQPPKSPLDQIWELIRIFLGG